MSLRLSSFFMGLGALLLACQAPPTTGRPCEVNSDCPDRLVCFLGTCQEECVAQADCMSGLHCAQWADLGSCLIDIPLDHTTSPCGPSRACPDASLTCRNFSCWNACTTGADCVTGSYCQRGVCVNGRSPGFGYGIHLPCTSAGDCMTGEICATDHGSQPTCRLPCTSDAQCNDTAAMGRCAAIDDPSVAPGTMACVLGCDPVRQAGCIDHDRCETRTAAGPGGAMRTVLDCGAPTGTTIQGAACGTTDPMYGTCAMGLGCAPAMADMTGGYECRHFCIDDGDCGNSMLTCTGVAAMGIENTFDVVGVLHMCQPR